MTMNRGQKGKVLTGARCRFKINGKTIGYARSVAITEEIQYDPVEVLDNIEVEEYVPVAYRVRFTASMFRIVSATLKGEGFFPESGKNSEEHLENVLLSGELAALIEDTKTVQPISTLQQVKVASHNWTIDARGIVGEDVEFNAIRVSDETEIA
jgi:hypothetical protein